jgi:hypothetical protein
LGRERGRAPSDLVIDGNVGDVDPSHHEQNSRLTSENENDQRDNGSPFLDPTGIEVFHPSRLENNAKALL